MDDDLDLGTAHDNEGGERPDIVTGNYVVTCSGIEDGGKSRFPRKDGDGNPILDRDGNEVFPDRWKWVLTVKDVDSKRPTEAQQLLVGQDIWQWTNKGMGPKSYTRAFVEAFLGRPLNAGETPKLGWVKGREAVASIVAEAGRVQKLTLTPYQDAGEDAPLGTTSKPASVPQLPVDDDERERILTDLYDLEDKRDLADMLDRIRRAQLDEDREVVTLYNMTRTRLKDGTERPSAQQRQLTT